jgi:hypothetical protein
LIDENQHSPISLDPNELAAATLRREVSLANPRRRTAFPLDQAGQRRGYKETALNNHQLNLKTPGKL